jgi:predicted transcriptional regulator of viral defense system
MAAAKASRSRETRRPPALGAAKAVFARHGGTLSAMAAIRMGVHPATLYRMRDEGDLVQIGRGLFRLATLPPLSNPDLVHVALRAPKCVVCLISALSFHDLTTQIPHEVSIAIPCGYRPPRLDHPPLRVFRFSGKALSAGVETHEIDGFPVRVYGPEKTIADCFRFRSKIGSDVAIEALKAYCRRKGAKVDDLLRYARVCRVEKVMQPYLEASLA